MKVKIRKGDTVEVISGRKEDKGKRGEVIKVLPDDGSLVISGVNVRKKAQREVQSQGRTLKPGMIEFEAPVSISNVMLVCPKCSKSTRVGVVREDGESQRVCKECGAIFD
ncbi:MAG: 50S ribosomal protein L24 [Chloroflexi bacterium RBG_16_58_14]|nr:MAG: 50S ribosomal protein L24 [Chloroflexi bacterium RBG_16_58_14]